MLFVSHLHALTFLDQISSGNFFPIEGIIIYPGGMDLYETWLLSSTLDGWIPPRTGRASSIWTIYMTLWRITSFTRQVIHTVVAQWVSVGFRQTRCHFFPCDAWINPAPINPIFLRDLHPLWTAEPAMVVKTPKHHKTPPPHGQRWYIHEEWEYTLPVTKPFTDMIHKMPPALWNKEKNGKLKNPQGRNTIFFN